MIAVIADLGTGLRGGGTYLRGWVGLRRLVCYAGILVFFDLLAMQDAVPGAVGLPRNSHSGGTGGHGDWA